MYISNSKHNPDREIADYAKKLDIGHARERVENGSANLPKPQEMTADHVFLNNIRPDQAREFLNNQIGRSIAELAPGTQAAAPAFKRNFSDANSTASNIIENVNQAANAIPASNENDAEPKVTLEDLINKIQEGFQQAKNAFEELNVMSQGFEPEFDQIQQQVNGFLQYLKDPINNTIPSTAEDGTAENGTANSSIETSEIIANQESYQTSSQTSIQIETRDGDIVTIDLSNSFSQQQSSASLQSDKQGSNFSGYVYEAYSESENSLAFTVSGELDEGELNAISSLVGDIAKTVGQFEKGNVNAALNIAKNINTQSEELSGFSFNVQTSEQYRAIDLYQKTQVTTSEPQPASENAAPANSSNIDSIFSNNISNHIYAAENANILEAAATV
ncbi:MAG: hypothetical protein OEM38_12365, partial [Gammaproteobacteria bacterium]|nr:hypothetical protein [Gammaproteobacteria bacterium]